MIYIFDGGDNFESYASAIKFAENLAKQKSSSIKIIDCEEVKSANDFALEVEGIGMFETNSIILAKRLLNNKTLIDYVLNLNSNTDIIIWHNQKADSKLKLVSKCKKEGNVYTFTEINESNIKLWLKKEVDSLNLKLNSSQIDLIIQLLPLDKGIFINELTKLKLYSDFYNKSVLDNFEIEQIIGADIKSNIWKFLEYFGKRDKINMINEFNKLLAYEDNTQYLIAMIARELNLIETVLRVGDSRLLKINPFVLKNTLAKSKNFNLEKINTLTQKLFDLDLSIKSGVIEEKLGLTLFLLTI